MQVQIKKLSLNTCEDICIASEEVFNSLDISTEIQYTFHLGQYEKPAYIKPTDKQGSLIEFSNHLFDELLLVENFTLNILKRDKDLYLGPVVGIFETERVINKIINNNPREDDLQHIHASLAENCLSYLFPIEGIDWTEKKIKGYTFSLASGSWEHRWFPFPDVFYDEGVFYSQKLKPLVNDIRRRFRSDPDIKVINSRNSLDKWDLNLHLSKYPEIKKHLPYTIVYRGFKDVLAMLKKYDLIFLKAFYGSKGHEVLSIQTEKAGYKLTFYAPSEKTLKTVIYSDVKELEKFVGSYTSNGKFIIQQGIQLLKYNGQSMDLRLLIMKNESGHWESMFNCCRIAKKDYTITNTSLGGDVVLYDLIYPDLVKSNPNTCIPTSKEIGDITIQIAAYIEKEFGSFGEIGMDMAVDIRGDIWIIEANAKPEKVLETNLIDIFGERIVDQIYKTYEKSSSCFISKLPNGDEILPQALATFKYSKYSSNFQ